MRKEEAYKIACEYDDSYSLCVEYKDSFMFGWDSEESGMDMIGPQPVYIFKKNKERHTILTCIEEGLIKPNDTELARYFIDEEGNFIERPVER